MHFAYVFCSIASKMCTDEDAYGYLRAQPTLFEGGDMYQHCIDSLTLIQRRDHSSSLQEEFRIWPKCSLII